MLTLTQFYQKLGQIFLVDRIVRGFVFQEGFSENNNEIINNEIINNEIVNNEIVNNISLILI